MMTKLQNMTFNVNKFLDCQRVNMNGIILRAIIIQASTYLQECAKP